jgi:hypothetical protein
MFKNYLKTATRVMATTPNAAGPAIQKDLPQVTATARMYQRSGILERRDEGRSEPPGDGGEKDGFTGWSGGAG